MTRFLVTGLPRCRSAWLAALLSAHGAPCVHEVEITFPGCNYIWDVFKAGYVGICDPSIYFRYPEQVELWLAGGHPSLVIERDANEARAATEKFLGTALAEWPKLVESLARFREKFNPMVCQFRDLNDAGTVHRIVEHLTGYPLDRRVFAVFDTLRIEQHIEKSAAKMPVGGAPWH